MTLSLKIAHLYGDLMNTYGDIGNIIALKYYGKQIGVEVTSEIVSLEENFKAEDYDIAVFGGGQDFEQSVVAKDLTNKKNEITKFIENNGNMIAICGGYQMLGHYYIDADGNKLPGIGALDHHTEQQDNHRFIGNVLIKNEETGQEYKGFENHQGITFTGKDERPLGDIINGNGNNGTDNFEGAIYKNTYCTYFHGPVLARNGNLAKRILFSALKQKYPNVDFTESENNLEIYQY
ncbi:glutamine amidotransferase [Lactobacillus sp. S2-2]|uniref:type 1 glutamine amidotransferase n=1 Tax=Lactobacillus sp. S2-2 TaxID=2692917 RepID=UPI001F390352|nr:glutamine amidotransferase [Lactobacillus sp. S2-2]MCF6515756.1 glutamine amidotransferase [Lactobacillus sp. S2-2]